MAEPLVGVEHLGKDEKKKMSGKKVIEKQDSPIPARQLQVNFEESEKRFHSLVAEPFCPSVR